MRNDYVSIGYILDNFHGVERTGYNTFIDFLNTRVQRIHIEFVGEIGDNWCEGEIAYCCSHEAIKEYYAEYRYEKRRLMKEEYYNRLNEAFKKENILDLSNNQDFQNKFKFLWL